MSHLSPADLVLFQTGDLADGGGASAHLATCARCRAELAAIERTLQAFDALEPPAMDAAYGRRIWNLIEPRLDRPEPAAPRATWAPLFSLRNWWAHAALAAATATLVTLVLDTSSMPWLSERASSGAAQSAATPTRRMLPEVAAGASERVLLSAVTEHLERTGMMLTDLTTAEDAAEVFDVAAAADDLASANRLYRQSASFSGDADVVKLLDDLERVLIEVAHASRDAGPADLDGLRGRLDIEDVQRRVRLAGTVLRDRGHAL